LLRIHDLRVRGKRPYKQAAIGRYKEITGSKRVPNMLRSVGMQRSNSPRKRISLSGKKPRFSSRSESETSTGSLEQDMIYDPAAFGPSWECS
jgi:hypothetical protein